MLDFSRPRRRTLLFVGVVAGLGFSTVVASRASVTFSLSRLGGPDRYATAAAIDEAGWTTTSSAALATGVEFPDALSGGYAGLPVLLTNPTALPTATSDAVRQLGVTHVTILGGTDAITPAVEDQLHAIGVTTSRLSGIDRFATAAAIALSRGPAGVGRVSDLPTAIIASGEDAHFADALTASPMEYAGRFPTLLTHAASLPAIAISALADLGITNALIVGGPAAVSPAVAAQLQSMGISVTRLGGDDRTATATDVANFELSTLAFSTSTVDLARGDLFPDSLVGGALGGKDLTPLLLSEDPNTLGMATSNWLTAHAKPLQSGFVFGGTAAFSDAAINQADTLVRTGSTTTAQMQFNGATTTAGTTTIDVSYSDAVNCLNVASDGSQFAAVIKGSNPGQGIIPVTKAACAGPTSPDDVTLTFSGTVQLTKGQTATITAQAGTNGTTVTDFVGNPQPVGNFIDATAR